MPYKNIEDRRKRWGRSNERTRTLDKGLLKKFYDMRARCYSPTATGYSYYGGRDIKVKWKSYQEFKDDMYKNYLNHLKKYGKENTTLDRINTKGNYSKINCRWATRKEQQNNREKTIKYLGENASDACKRLKGKSTLIHDRLFDGWSLKEAFTIIKINYNK